MKQSPAVKIVMCMAMMLMVASNSVHGARMLKQNSEPVSEIESSYKRDVFESLDSDHSGGISLPEFVAGVYEYGSNASLTAEELMTEFDRMDLNGDGILSYEEVFPQPLTPEQLRQKIFDQIDGNLDGKITFEEFKNHLSASFGAHELPSEAELLAEFNMADKNGDGSLTISETNSPLDG